MRTQLRIVAGSMRGRKITCDVNQSLRPTPQMVREALFSILGNAVPDRPFFDVFAGTGVVGLEALSRGASHTTFVERDFRLIAELEKHIAVFGVHRSANIARADVYRWAERWRSDKPATIFISPPFPDLEERGPDLMTVIRHLQERGPVGTVIALQAERDVPLEGLPDPEHWDLRQYGRNMLLFWVKEEVKDEAAPAEAVDPGQ